MFSDQSVKRKFRAGWLLLVLIVFVVGTTIVAAVDGLIVRVERVKVSIPGLDPTFEGARILLLSDLHGKRFGAGQRSIANVLSKVDYDIACVCGDVLGPDENPDPFYELLDVLQAGKHPVYFIAGDEDPPALIGEPHYTNEVIAEFVTGAQRKGAIYVDAPQQFSYKGKSIWIMPGTQLSLDLDNAERQYRNQLRKDQFSGNAQLPGIKARMRLINYQLDAIERSRTANAAMQIGDLRIAMIHVPLRSDFVRNLQSTDGSASGAAYPSVVNLVLAGHYNGGQVRIPFVGPIYVASDELPRKGWFPGDSRIQGLNHVSGVAQVISAGLGVSNEYMVRFRLFNAPKITVVELTGALATK